MAEKSKYQDIDAVDAALDKGVAASTAIGDSSSGLTKKVTDLELEICYEKPYNGDKSIGMGSSVWETGTCYFYDVKKGDNVNIVANNSANCVFSILTSNDTNTAPSFATGFNNAKYILPGNSISIEVPDNGKYLFVSHNEGGIDRTPESININGFSVNSLSKDMVFSNSKRIDKLGESIDNKVDKCYFDKLQKEFEETCGIEVTNYALLFDVLEGKTYNNNGELVDSMDNDASPLVELDTSKVVHSPKNVIFAYFYDENKKYIESKYSTPSSPVKSFNENAKYVAFRWNKSGLEGDLNISAYEYPYTWAKYAPNNIVKHKGIRPIINITTNMSDIDIYNLMCEAYLIGDCDVHFETGTYTFAAYSYMQSIGATWTMEYPIGGNCRYYLHNSTIIGVEPDGYTGTARNTLGTKASAASFEIHDGTVINKDGLYVIHTEANVDTNMYKQVFHNVTLKYEKYNEAIFARYNTHCCVGLGCGLDGVITFENCVLDGGTTASGLSGHDSNAGAGKMALNICGCLIKGGVHMGIEHDGYIKAKLMFSNNEYTSTIGNFDGWDTYMFNNKNANE